MRKIGMGIILGIVVVICFIGGVFLGKPMLSNKTVVNVSTLEQQILSIGELATLQYNYKNAVVLKNSRDIKGWDIPLTQKSFDVI